MWVIENRAKAAWNELKDKFRQSLFLGTCIRTDDQNDIHIGFIVFDSKFKDICQRTVITIPSFDGLNKCLQLSIKRMLFVYICLCFVRLACFVLFCFVFCGAYTCVNEQQLQKEK